MSSVHPTAILEGDVDLADDVVIGPHCVLTGPVSLGAGTRLIGNVYLFGPLVAGSDNLIYPFTCLGFAPQHTASDPGTSGPGVAIGSGNTFREQVTLSRAFTDEGPTTIGDGNCFMAGSHVGHDSRVGNECVFVNHAMLGGHVIVEDRVTVGAASFVHQFCHIGRGVMFAGAAGTTRDVPPYFMITGINICGSVNLVGLRRSDRPRDQIDDARWVYRTLYRKGLSMKAAVEALEERADRPMVAEYLRFFESSNRGICPAKGQAVRGMAGEKVISDQ